MSSCAIPVAVAPAASLARRVCDVACIPFEVRGRPVDRYVFVDMVPNKVGRKQKKRRFFLKSFSKKKKE